MIVSLVLVCAILLHPVTAHAQAGTENNIVSNIRDDSQIDQIATLKLTSEYCRLLRDEFRFYVAIEATGWFVIFATGATGIVFNTLALNTTGSTKTTFQTIGTIALAFDALVGTIQGIILTRHRSGLEQIDRCRIAHPYTNPFAVDGVLKPLLTPDILEGQWPYDSSYPSHQQPQYIDTSSKNSNLSQESKDSTQDSIER